MGMSTSSSLDAAMAVSASPFVRTCMGGWGCCPPLVYSSSSLLCSGTSGLFSYKH